MQSGREKIERAREIARHPVTSSERALAHQRPDGVIGEWKNVPPEEQNVYQRIADKTHGIVTPGNGVTLAGVGLTMLGLKHYRRGEHVKGTVYTFLGRFVGDVGDGAAAAATKTRGAPGALLDATADKLLAAAYIHEAVKKGDMHPAKAITYVLQQARSARENARLKLAGGEPNPSAFGKWGQALLWLEAGGTMVRHSAQDMGQFDVAKRFETASEVASLGAIILNERAADEYERRRIDHIASLAITNTEV